tara:strand:+ start:257 stop:544 length:288 start_codon:yes stop_codon:yes gene_type:complete
MVGIKKLTVSTDEERKGWIQLLETAIAYHWDMSGQFEPEIKTPNKDSDMEKVAEIHRVWARAIQDTIELIDMWEIESSDEVLTPHNTVNITPEKK